MHVDMAEPGGLHHRLQFGLARMHSDRLGQIAIAVGITRSTSSRKALFAVRVTDETTAGVIASGTVAVSWWPMNS